MIFIAWRPKDYTLRGAAAMESASNRIHEITSSRFACQLEEVQFCPVPKSNSGVVPRYQRSVW